MTEDFSQGIAAHRPYGMPRPKPLSIQNRAKAGKHQSPDGRNASGGYGSTKPFGVQGVSPLTHLANTMLREQ